MRIFLYYILIGLLGTMLLVGCTTKALEPSKVTMPTDEGKMLDIVMTVEEVSNTGLTFVMRNNTPNEGMFGAPFLLEVRQGEEWLEVPVTIEEEYGYPDIGYILDPNSVRDEQLDWEWLYGKLAPGEYRLVKEAYIAEENYTLLADFLID